MRSMAPSCSLQHQASFVCHIGAVFVIACLVLWREMAVVVRAVPRVVGNIAVPTHDCKWIMNDPGMSDVNLSDCIDVDRTVCADSLTVRNAGCKTEGKGWNCSQHSQSVVVSGDCEGLFELQGVPTICASGLPKGNRPVALTCAKGREFAGQFCPGFMLLGSFFVTIQDWQSRRDKSASFDKILKLYYTSLAHGVSLTVIHDGLDVKIVEHWQSQHFNLILVDPNIYVQKYQLGNQDARYFFFADLVRSHHEWEYVFMIDAFDVQIGMVPCLEVERERIYIGSQYHGSVMWLNKRFHEMGGRYLEWWQQNVSRTETPFLNNGIVGGHRGILLKFLERMLDVYRDDNIAVRHRRNGKRQVHIDMSIVYYLGNSEFKESLFTGHPLHSRYHDWEVQREDVWFIHK